MKKISEMTVAELRARAAEIRGLVDKPDADLEALDTEATEIAQRLQQAEMEARRKAIAGKVAGGDGVQVRNFPDRVEGEGEYTADSAEYRKAWLKTIAVDARGRHLFGELTDAERRAFTFLTTNTSAVVPTEIANRIIELVRSEAPMLDDAEWSFFTRGFGVPRHKSIDAGDADVVTEGTANPNDEKDTFDLLELAGVEIKKHAIMSKKMEIQSIEAFETWLVDHIAKRLRVAAEAHVLEQLDDTGAGIATTNKISGTLSDAEIRKAFGLLGVNGEKVIYANNATIWNDLAGLEGSDGQKLFIPSSMDDPLTAGRIYGARVKEDANVPANTLYIMVRGQLLCNEFSPIEVVPQIEPKTLNRIFTGYWLFDAGLENPTGAVKYTNTAG